MNPSMPSGSQGPPPLPPRPFEQTGHQPMMGGYGTNSLYGNQFGAGAFGSYAPMHSGLYGGGMYGGGPMGYNQYGGYGGTGMDGNFAKMAEESSRSAFQSIESVVNAVNSVATMLSSTHQAVYSSFRAVIGVVEQMGRLKGQLSSVLLSLSLYRLLVKLWRSVLVWLRLKPANYASATELAWGDAKQPYGSELLGSTSGPGVSWPSILFWVVALGGPWLIYKCINQMVAQTEEKRKWATGNGAHYTAKAQFDFQANSEQELSFMKDEILRVAPKEQQPRVRGWLLASNQEGSRIGMVPINYVKIVGKQSDSPPPTETVENVFDNSFKPSYSQQTNNKQNENY